MRKGLKAGLCDVIPGVPTNFKQVRTTRPYYTASYAFVQSPDAKPITSFDDAKLRDARIGVQLVGDDGANTPPMTELAQRGITHNIRGFMVYGDWSKSDPLSPIVGAVAHHDVDVALVWGPVAGYYAARQNPPLRSHAGRWRRPHVLLNLYGRSRAKCRSCRRDRSRSRETTGGHSKHPCGLPHTILTGSEIRNRGVGIVKSALSVLLCAVLAAPSSDATLRRKELQSGNRQCERH